MSRTKKTPILAFLLGTLFFGHKFPTRTESYVIPDIGREELAGIWRLTSKKSFFRQNSKTASINSNAQRQDLKQRGPFPMKEFTVHPMKATARKIRSDNVVVEETTLLKLNDDGSFLQYSDISAAVEDYDEDDDQVVDAESGTIMGVRVFKGTWDYSDSDRTLILAADRPSDSNELQVHDTILIGEVVARSNKELLGNPIVLSKSTKESDTNQTTINSGDTNDEKDVYLSVPDGQVSIGKFTYPKHHPSFFEEPIFNPLLMGNFQLQQVLGILNAKQKKKDEFVERFVKENLYGRKFLLTSMPIQQKRGKAKLRWNRHEGKYVEDRPPQDPNEKIDIRVMPIEFFANDTFCAFGQSKVLRGRWSITGEKRDNLWFEVRRFGFGRSVSGSVFSEGNGLTGEDERAYWGKIRWEEDDNSNDDDDSTNDKNIKVGGTVLIGCGLEPLPIGRFTMKEIHAVSLNDDDNNEDDDNELFTSVFE